MTEAADATRNLPARLSAGGVPLRGMDDLARVAKVMAESGYFKDANTPQKIAVKMFFAMAMGFDPIAGLTGVDLIDGNPTPNAHFWAAAIEDSPLYDYEVLERTNERCTIAFFRRQPDGEWRKRGEVTWTMEDARQAALTGKDNWKKYPRAMLYSRAMTEGGRAFCPGLFGGVRAYTPEELDPDIPVVGPGMPEGMSVMKTQDGDVVIVDAAGQIIEPDDIEDSVAAEASPSSASAAGPRADEGDGPMTSPESPGAAEFPRPERDLPIKRGRYAGTPLSEVISGDIGYGAVMALNEGVPDDLRQLILDWMSFYLQREVTLSDCNELVAT